MASRNEQAALFRFSSAVVLTAMDPAASAEADGRATSTMARIMMAVSNLLKNEEVIGIARIVVSFQDRKCHVHVIVALIDEAGE
jgi:hypothetical protein